MKPFDKKLSLELDKATLSSESDDKTRAKLGKEWKRRIEKKIFDEEGKDAA